MGDLDLLVRQVRMQRQHSATLETECCYMMSQGGMQEIPSIKRCFSCGGNVKMSWFGSLGKILAQHQLPCPRGHKITPLVGTECLYEQCLCPTWQQERK